MPVEVVVGDRRQEDRNAAALEHRHLPLAPRRLADRSAERSELGRGRRGASRGHLGTLDARHARLGGPVGALSRHLVREVGVEADGAEVAERPHLLDAHPGVVHERHAVCTVEKQHLAAAVAAQEATVGQRRRRRLDVALLGLLDAVAAHVALLSQLNRGHGTWSEELGIDQDARRVQLFDLPDHHLGADGIFEASDQRIHNQATRQHARDS
mmetsp:Transcript_28868/g.67121  ORF Transcript_28868/g.67121 Transcript_28868/m.67121 type:complete len:212 (+) Transcript_28868:238-873(+)